MDRTRDDTEAEITAFLAGRLPDSWFVGPPGVTVDREEILVVGDIGRVDPPGDTLPAGETREAAAAVAASGRIRRFREDTRAERMVIADDLEYRYGRKVAWGATCNGRTEVFTNLSVPVMTRLRLAERRVLDTLVDAGVARSRSDALAWCVKLVGANQSEWIERLRASLIEVERIRAEGPRPS